MSSSSSRLGLELIALVVILAVAYKQLLQRGSMSSSTPPTTGTVAGVDFPSLGSNIVFLGGGTRTKYGIAQIYAAGLYVDKRAPAQWSKHYASAGDALLADIARDAGYSKSIVLSFLRSVDAEKVQESLQQELSKRLDAAATAAFVEKLHAVFPPDRVTKGTQITMTCAPGGNNKLTFESNGKTSTLGNDKNACPALWDVYIGKQAVSKDIRQGFQKGVTEQLSANE